MGIAFGRPIDTAALELDFVFHCLMEHDPSYSSRRRRDDDDVNDDEMMIVMMMKMDATGEEAKTRMMPSAITLQHDVTKM
jgi:hypothetical protein